MSFLADRHLRATQDGDAYQPTSLGLFSSGHSGRCQAVLDGALKALSRLFNDNPDVSHLTRAEVLQSAPLLRDVPCTEVVAVLEACDLSAGGSYSNTDFRLRIPSDIEHVVHHRTGNDMLRCGTCDKTRWQPNRSVTPAIPQVSLDPEPTTSDTASSLDCSYVDDPELARILRRDCEEITLCMEAGAWKAAIVLCGGVLEGLLIFGLERTNHLHGTPPRLSELINLGGKYGLLGTMSQALPDALRDHRNLIHPDKERRGGYKIDRPEANIALSILEAALRDVSEAVQKHRDLQSIGHPSSLPPAAESSA